MYACIVYTCTGTSNEEKKDKSNIDNRNMVDTAIFKLHCACRWVGPEKQNYFFCIALLSYIQHI